MATKSEKSDEAKAAEQKAADAKVSEYTVLRDPESFGVSKIGDTVKKTGREAQALIAAGLLEPTDSKAKPATQQQPVA